MITFGAIFLICCLYALLVRTIILPCCAKIDKEDHEVTLDGRTGKVKFVGRRIASNFSKHIYRTVTGAYVCSMPNISCVDVYDSAQSLHTALAGPVGFGQSDFALMDEAAQHDAEIAKIWTRTV